MSFIPPPHVRPIAVCIVRRDDSILVFQGHDSVKGQTFFRPLGGSIEFGELGADAVPREFREEIGAELRDVKYLATLENRFTYEGHPGHEIVLVYDAEFADQALYEIDATEGLEDEGGTFKVVWKPLSQFGLGGDPLYPEGLPQLLAESG